MLEIKIDMGALALALGALPHQIEAASERGLDDVADDALEQKQREIAKTYARPIPKDKNGKPKWKRSEDWKNEQTIESKTGSRAVFSSGRSADYEAHLAQLPTSKDGINRSNPASENAEKIVENRAQAIMEDAIKKALNL